MIINFTFGNFRSFKESATLSMIASSKLRSRRSKDGLEEDELDGNVFTVPQHSALSLLHVVAIYGANASGKSNIISAMSKFRETVVESANSGFRLLLVPFLFAQQSHYLPISFELTFLMDGVQYRYGFMIANKQRQEIMEEWLYRATSSKETTLFEREGDLVDRKRPFSEGMGLLRDKRVARKEALFLSLCALAGGDLSSKIVDYINSSVVIISGAKDQNLRDTTTQYLEQGKYGDFILRLLQDSDTGIARIRLVEEDELDQQMDSRVAMADSEKKRLVGNLRLQTEHTIYGEDGKPAGSGSMPMVWLESEGTQKLYNFAGPIASALEHGTVLIIDEMDAKWHPLMTKSLVRLFQSPISNPRHAQLVFATHDTNLLDCHQFRRDQIWFVEKDNFGASHLYSLVEFKGVRKESYESDYILGRYGAVPILGDFTKLFEELPATTDEPEAEVAHHAET